METIINNDIATQTIVTLKIDNKVSYSLLNRFILELEDLSTKYSIVFVKEGAISGR